MQLTSSNSKSVLLRRIATLLCTLSLVTPGAAQDLDELPELGGRKDDAAQELVELFHKVERNLERIDLDLADAGAGEVPLQKNGESGLLELLRESQRQSREVEASINRILQIAQDMGQGQSQSSPGGDSPLDQQRGNKPQGRERTPEAPKQPGEPKDSPSDQERKDQPNPKTGENKEGEPPKSSPGDPRAPGNDANEWGFLPDRLRDVFRNQGRDHLPVRYRTWIDSYYRRLNRSDR